MEKYVITLELSTDFNPNKWNWHEMLELHSEEKLFVNIKQEVK